MNPANDNITPGDWVELWLEDGSVSDGPISGLVERSDEHGLVLRRESLVPETMQPEEGDYGVAWRDILTVELPRPVEPPPLTEPPTLRAYYYWERPWRSKSFWRVLVWCPECRDVHRHGAGSDEPPTAGRWVAHCADESNSAYEGVGYSVANPELIPERCENGHPYAPGNIVVTANGLHCRTCEPNIREAKTAAPLSPVPDLTTDQRKRFVAKVVTDEATGCQYRKGVGRNRPGGNRGGTVKLYPNVFHAYRVALKIAGRCEPDGYKAVPDCGDDDCINPEHRRFVPL